MLLPFHPVKVNGFVDMLQMLALVRAMVVLAAVMARVLVVAVVRSFVLRVLAESQIKTKLHP